jgi:hypothetical protein
MRAYVNLHDARIIVDRRLLRFSQGNHRRCALLSAVQRAIPRRACKTNPDIIPSLAHVAASLSARCQSSDSPQHSSTASITTLAFTSSIFWHHSFAFANILTQTIVIVASRSPCSRRAASSALHYASSRIACSVELHTPLQSLATPCLYRPPIISALQPTGHALHIPQTAAEE